MEVLLIDARPDSATQLALSLPVGATVADALRAAAGTVDAAPDVGVWGRCVPLSTPLADGDRIELYRPLIADPKAARKKRATEQGYRWQGRTRRAVRQPVTSP